MRSFSHLLRCVYSVTNQFNRFGTLPTENPKLLDSDNLRTGFACSRWRKLSLCIILTASCSQVFQLIVGHTFPRSLTRPGHDVFHTVIYSQIGSIVNPFLVSNLLLFQLRGLDSSSSTKLISSTVGGWQQPSLADVHGFDSSMNGKELACFLREPLSRHSIVDIVRRKGTRHYIMRLLWLSWRRVLSCMDQFEPGANKYHS